MAARQKFFVDACTRDDEDSMIECENGNCPAQWFHFACVGLDSASIPAGSWFCLSCRGQERSDLERMVLLLQDTVAMIIVSLQALQVGQQSSASAALQPAAATPPSSSPAPSPPPTAAAKAPPPPTFTAPLASSTWQAPAVPPASAPQYVPTRSALGQSSFSALGPSSAVHTSASAAVHPSTSARTRPLTMSEDVNLGSVVISKDLTTTVLNGGYTDFLLFLHPITAVEEHLTLRDGLRVAGRRIGRLVSSFHLWLKAWANYEELLGHLLQLIISIIISQIDVVYRITIVSTDLWRIKGYVKNIQD